jgi:hypothetical protein
MRPAVCTIRLRKISKLTDHSDAGRFAGTIWLACEDGPSDHWKKSHFLFLPQVQNLLPLLLVSFVTEVSMDGTLHLHKSVELGVEMDDGASE